MEPQRISLRDIAEKVGVSHTAVSLALRGSHRVATKKREEIIRVARELGYKSDPMLTALSRYRDGKQKKTVTSELALVHSWAEPEAIRASREFSICLEAARKQADFLGYRLQDYELSTTGIKPHRLRSILEARGTLGVLIPPHKEPPLLAGMDWTDLSIVKIGRSVREPRAHRVTANQFRAGRVAIEHLHKVGFRKIGYLTTRTFEINTGRQFYGGCFTAMMDYDEAFSMQPLELDASALANHDVRQIANLHSLIAREKPDVLLCSLTSKNIEFLRSSKKKIIPPICSLSILDGGCTAGVDQRPDEIGRAAVDLLHSLILMRQTGEPPVVRTLQIEPKWSGEFNRV